MVPCRSRYSKTNIPAQPSLCTPWTEMMTILYEWNILERQENNIQSINHSCKIQSRDSNQKDYILSSQYHWCFFNPIIKYIFSFHSCAIHLKMKTWQINIIMNSPFNLHAVPNKLLYNDKINECNGSSKWNTHHFTQKSIRQCAFD